jgi:putative ABC transport system ATP-binding protein
MLSTSQLQKVYRSSRIETTALDGIDLEIRTGEFIAVMGPSGCGKSTLLNLLGLLDNPSRGQLIFQGQDVTNLPERKRARLRRGNIGFVFQTFHLISELTVAENVELSLLYLKVPRAERSRRVQEALERVGLAHRRDHRPNQLSGGQQQRAAVARAIVADPSLILADEPTGNLDSRNGAEIMNLLAEINREATTIVMATHSAIDARFSDRILYLYDGKVVPQDPATLSGPAAAPKAAVTGASRVAGR